MKIGSLYTAESKGFENSRIRRGHEGSRDHRIMGLWIVGYSSCTYYTAAQEDHTYNAEDKNS